MKSLLLAVLVTALAIVPAVSGQIVTIGTGTVTNTSTSYPTPYGNYYSGMRCQYIIPASELAAAGMATVPIASIEFDVVALGGAILQDFTIKLGHTTAMDLSGGFDPASLIEVVGPQSYLDVMGWNVHPTHSPFSWNATDNLLVDICFWNGAGNFTTNAVVNSSTMTYTSSYTEYDDSTPPCGAGATFSASSLDRPNMRFGFSAVPPDWQENSPQASLDANGVQVAGPHALGGAVASNLVGTPSFINVSSVLTLTAFDILVGTAPLVPATAGGLTTFGGQLVNMDITSPDTQFLFGDGFVPGYIPFPFNFSIGAIFTAPITLSGQMLMVDYTYVDTFVLSQGAQLDVIGSQSVSFSGDDTLGIVTLAQPIPFYGQVWTQVDVSTNGWIKFGGTSTFSDLSENADDFVNGTWGGGTPTPGIAVLWTDLDMANRPTSMVTVTQSFAGILQVDWVDGDYYPNDPFGNVTCIIDMSGAVSPARVTLDYTGYMHATPPSEGVVGVSSGTTMLPAMATALDIVQTGVVVPYANMNSVETLFQNFDGTGTLVPPIAAQPFDLGGLVLTFDDVGTGVGAWTMY